MIDRSRNVQPSSQDLDRKVEACRTILRQMKRVMVAFSAGVDSSYLLALALEVLGTDDVLAAVGVSPSLPRQELATARMFAKQFGVELVEVKTSELADPRYVANPFERCYFCKLELFGHLIALAKEHGFDVVVSGVNADDVGDFRPGLKAGKEFEVRNPLLEAGLSKTDIRKASQRMELPTWDKPSMACLASRVPYGQKITAERLYRIEQAEQAMKEQGFCQLRVRDHDSVARIEIPLTDIDLLLAQRNSVVSALKKCGYTYITLDLSGFRSGSSNEVLH